MLTLTAVYNPEKSVCSARLAAHDPGQKPPLPTGWYKFIQPWCTPSLQSGRRLHPGWGGKGSRA